MNVFRSMSGARSRAASQEKKLRGTNQFSNAHDYNEVLNNLRSDLEQKWVDNTPSPETGLDGYELKAILGAGSFGNVRLIKVKDTDDEYYAVKILIKDHIVKTKQIRHVFNEKRVLKCVDFPFLVSLVFSTKDNDCLYLALPFIIGGELFKYHRKVRKFSEKQTLFYTTQVVLALEYMHHCQLLYRDLKPENIMICGNGYIKLTDFGFTKRVESRTMTLCGTPEYLAPEIIQTKPYGSGTDWWALGVLTYELVSGNSPFAEFHKDVMLMYSKICAGEYKMQPYFSDGLRKFIKALLQVDVTRRLGSLSNGSRDVKKHEWFKTIEWYSILNQQISAPYVPVVLNFEDFSHFDKWPDEPIISSKGPKYSEIFADF